MDDKTANREALTQMIGAMSIEVSRYGYQARAAALTANQKWEEQAQAEVVRMQKIKDFYAEELKKLG